MDLKKKWIYLRVMKLIFFDELRINKSSCGCSAVRSSERVFYIC